MSDTSAGMPGSRPPASASLILPRRTVLKGAAVLGGGLLLAACGGSDSSGRAASRGITITDQRGKVLTFDQPVKRIITLPMPAASIVIAVDRTAKHLVGMNDASWTAVRDGTLGTAFPDALSVRHDVAGPEFAPNIESILALEPDVVVQWASQGDEIITPLEKAGLPVLGVNYGTLQDVNTWLTMFATMLGKNQRAQDMNARLIADRDAVVARTESTSGSRPRVLYFLRSAESLTVTGAGSYNDEYIRLVGGSNAAAEIPGPNQDVDIEKILDWDPEIVLLGNFDGGMPADIYGDKVWATTAAVKSRRVYKVPFGGYRWDPPSHESPLMWNWLSALVHPEAEQIDLRGKIGDDYDFFYGARPDDAEIDKILWTDINNESANYQQFNAS